MNSTLPFRPWGQSTIFIFKWGLLRWYINVPLDTEKVVKQPLAAWNVLVKPEREGKCLKNCFKLTWFEHHELCNSFSISGGFLNKFVLIRLIKQVKLCMSSIINIAQIFASFSRDAKL